MIEVVCVGDSITAYYQTALGNLILDNGGAVINLKVSSEQTPDLVTRFSSQVSDRLPKFSYVVIMEGGNDINVSGRAAVEIEANLQSCYTSAHNAGIKVIALTITPLEGAAGFTDEDQVILDAVNAWIMNDAVDVDYCVDAYTVLENPSVPDQMLPVYDSGDHIHPSASGGDALANAIASVLNF